MKPESGILIGIGAVSLFLLYRGQAKAENGEQPLTLPSLGGLGGGLALTMPEINIPAMPEINIPAFPNIAFPELSFSMPEFQAPTAIPDIGQQITNALAGLGAGGDLIIPGLPTVEAIEGGNGDPGFFGEVAATIENLKDVASDIARGATAIAGAAATTTGFVQVGTEKVADIEQAMAVGAKEVAQRTDPWDWVLNPAGTAAKVITDTFFAEDKQTTVAEKPAPQTEPDPIVERWIVERQPSDLEIFLTL